MHSPPQAARQSVQPQYQMAKALLPMVHTLPVLLPDPLTGLLVGGRRHEASL